jgi:hypothetical protein
MFHEYSHVPIPLLRKIIKDKQYHMLNGIIETIVDGIRGELLSGNISFKKIKYVYKREGQKIRRIGIQDIKQQLYDYIAVNGLMEMLRKKICHYQCAALPHKGQVFGARAIKRWLKNKAYKYAWKADVHHCFENISHEIMMSLLNKCVKNKPLLDLVQLLLNTFEKGLSIGSYLSQYLANFYLSYSLHYINEQLFKIRKCRDGTIKRVRLAYKAIFYMDDILIIGKSMKDLKMAAKLVESHLKETLDLALKETAHIINLATDYIDMMGYKMSRKNTTVRSRIFIKIRAGIKHLKRLISTKVANITQLNKHYKSVSARKGWLDNSNSRHFKKKTKLAKTIKKAKEIIKKWQK